MGEPVLHVVCVEGRCDHVLKVPEVNAIEDWAADDRANIAAAPQRRVGGAIEGEIPVPRHGFDKSGSRIHIHVEIVWIALGVNIADAAERHHAELSHPSINVYDIWNRFIEIGAAQVERLHHGDDLSVVVDVLIRVDANIVPIDFFVRALIAEVEIRDPANREWGLFAFSTSQSILDVPNPLHLEHRAAALVRIRQRSCEVGPKPCHLDS